MPYVLGAVNARVALGLMAPLALLGAAIGFVGGKALASVTDVGAGLLAVGCLASYAMGANDVANASGALIGPHVLSASAAGPLRGVGLAAGVLITGRPLLNRVAFDIVTVDRATPMAVQFVQTLVILAAVSFGYFTSMNQALADGMAGAGLARARHIVHAKTLVGILRGWVTGPPTSFALALVAALVVRWASGAGSVAQ